ncbi:MAG: hypothetical protein HC824_11610 [Synechococcales cyanobacterium RM1_1_8]|nr:hypothetical protein [Synechococcales cyanobacterium RM1_1_8]
MNLPLTLDIAIGLIFIYLTFSLLASELQELVTTILQWRAVHLKQSIEGFLSGNQVVYGQEARTIANRLYEHPSIQSLNHEAKGGWARLPRLVTRLIPTQVFGQRTTGPSYIDSKTFALGLLETLGLNQLVQKLTVRRFGLCFEEMLGAADYERVREQLRSSLRAYENGAMSLDVLVDQAGDRISQLNQAVFEQYFADSSQRPFLIQQLSVKLTDILQASYLYLSLSWRSRLCLRTLQLVERRTSTAEGKRAFNTNQTFQAGQTAAASKIGAQIIQDIRAWTDIPASLRPTLVILAVAWMQKRNQVNIKAVAQLPEQQLRALGVSASDLDNIAQAELFYKSFFVYEQAKQALEGKQTVVEVEQLFQSLRDGGDLPSYFDSVLDQTLDTLALIVMYPEVRGLVEKIPLSVLESLQIPARKMQRQFDGVGEQLQSFEGEVAAWFDRSMERAGGVYKRNARLVAFCLGLGIAVVANVDTLHVVDHLTQERALEGTVASLVDKIDAEQALSPNGVPSQAFLQQLSQQVYPELPVGWGPENLMRQGLRDGTVKRAGGEAGRSRSPCTSPHAPNPGQGGGMIQFVLRRLFGWLITGLAISMGAAFWYDLLGKFIQIRNVGKKPSS